MEHKHTFNGISSNSDFGFDDRFDVVYDSVEEIVAVSKEEYKCYLGSKTIHYRIGIQLSDAAWFGESGVIYATVGLVPSYRCIPKDKREEFRNHRCDDDVNYGKKDDTDYFLDAVMEGYYTVLANERYEYDEDGENAVENKFNEIKSDIVNTYIGMTGLIGFYLDRSTNLLGMTGWDWLRIYCNGVKTQTIVKEIISKREKNIA